jgi:hypothetical protein
MNSSIISKKLSEQNSDVCKLFYHRKIILLKNNYIKIKKLNDLKIEEMRRTTTELLNKEPMVPS